MLSAVSSVPDVSLSHFFFLVNKITTQMPVTPQTCHVFNFTHSSHLRPHFTPKYLQFFLNDIPVIQLSLFIHSLISLQAFIILINTSIKHYQSIFIISNSFCWTISMVACTVHFILSLPSLTDSSSHTCPREDLTHPMHYMN